MYGRCGKCKFWDHKAEGIPEKECLRGFAHAFMDADLNPKLKEPALRFMTMESFGCNEYRAMSDASIKLNQLITIGYLGVQRAYLNVDLEEAKQRYCEYDGGNMSQFEGKDGTPIRIIEFDDEFGTYSCWPA